MRNMKWSRYSKLFQSKRNGWMLFSSASRAFLLVKDEELPVIRGIMADPEGYDYSGCPMLYMQLRALEFLVEDGKDDELFNIVKMRHLTDLYADRHLNLTFALTTACNFDCSYCFETSHKGHTMTQETEDKVMDFIRRFNAPSMSITWYGGEPLLAWDRIISIDRRLKDMGKRYDAAMITNGYLLTKERAAKLNDLNVTYLQITLDGKKETHDARRYLAGGAPTYERILQNIDGLMETDFKSMLHVRVNVDGRNSEEFADVYKMMQTRYPKDFGRRIRVYPGFVKGDSHPDRGCFFDPVQQGEFITEMMEKYQIAPLNIFPRRMSPSCVLTKRNAFVVGPDGELYKCWDDVGIKEKIVGSINRFDNWNMGLIAEGMTGCSFLDDPECRDCFYFPVCNGGCHRIRQKNLHAAEKKSACTYFNGNLENLLELFYEEKQRAAAQKKTEQPAGTAIKTAIN